jgi:NADH-quinone oxidoreductase subunit J
MNADIVVFLILAFVAVGSALGMLLNRNAVYSALFLILNFATVAVFYLVLGAPFIAMTQVTVYAGAIMVLFLFVIMLLGAEELPLGKTHKWQWRTAILFGVILLGEAYYEIFVRQGGYPWLQEAPADFASPAAIGQVFFQQYFLPFQITGVLLLVAMVGAIVITRHEKKKDKKKI